MRDFCNKCNTNYRERISSHLKQRHLICKNEWKKEWTLRNPDYKRKYHLKTMFGISIEQYNEKFEKQNGQCDICGIHQSNLKNTLGVDHCHERNVNRGLLCTRCNLLIGEAKDDASILQRAIIYLAKYSELKMIFK